MLPRAQNYVEAKKVKVRLVRPSNYSNLIFVFGVAVKKRLNLYFGCAVPSVIPAGS